MRETLILIAIFGLAGCAMSKKDTGDWETGGWRDTAEQNDTEPPPSDTGGIDDTDHGSEVEDSFLMLRPAATPAYVFVVNPDRDTLTRVTVPGLEVITVDVGTQPTVVTTTADYGKAITFNEGSNDISVVDAETLDVVTLPVRDNLNAMEMSPDGVWVVCFHDADLEDEGTDDGGGIQSFNEVSFVNTETYEVQSMVVGENPRQVQFTDDSGLAVVVSDEELALVDLGATVLIPSMVTVAEDPLSPARAEEVAISPDGSWLFARMYGSEEVLVVDLVTEDVGRIAVGFNPTDLDLIPDGSKAVVVSRGAGELWLLDTVDPFATPEVLTMPVGEELGSLVMTPDGSKGILYTNAVLDSRYTIWDVASGTFEVQLLVKPVQSVSLSPTGDTMLVFHTEEDADDGQTDPVFAGEWALTLIDLRDLRQNPLRLAGEPLAYADSIDGTHGYFIMKDQPWFEVLDYERLLPTDVELRSVPLFVGTLPYTPFAYVSQDHPLGRISFYDADDASLETITGFELNSQIEH